MTKLSLDELVAKAKNRNLFDPQRTAARVKATRKSKITLRDLNPPAEAEDTKKQTSTEDKESQNTESTKNIENSVDKKEESVPVEKLAFELPTAMSVLKQAIEIIKSNPGEKEISIWKKQVKISDKWLIELQTLLP